MTSASWSRSPRRAACRRRRARRVRATPPTARYFDSVMERFGLTGSSALVLEGSERTSGLPWADVLERADAADLLVNISGHLDVESLMSAAAAQGIRGPRPRLHPVLAGRGRTRHAARGPRRLLHRRREHRHAGCPIPAAGIDWQPMRPPVVLDQWPLDRGARPRSLHHHRHLARRLRSRRVRGTQLRPQGARVPKVARAAAARAGTLRDRARHPSRRFQDLERCTSTAGGSSTRGRSLTIPTRFRRLRAGIRSGVLGRAGRLRGDLQRLVQRPHRRLPRLRQAGAGSGHGPRRNYRSGRAWSPSGRSKRRSRAPSGSAPTIRRTARPRGRWPSATSTPTRCWPTSFHAPESRSGRRGGRSARRRHGWRLAHLPPRPPGAAPALDGDDSALHPHPRSPHRRAVHPQGDVRAVAGRLVHPQRARCAHALGAGRRRLRRAADVRGHPQSLGLVRVLVPLPDADGCRNAHRADVDVRLRAGRQRLLLHRHPGLHRRGLRQPGHRPDHARARLRPPLRELHAHRRQGSRRRQGGAGQVREHAAGLPGLPAASSKFRSETPSSRH